MPLVRPQPRGITEQHGRHPFRGARSRGCFCYSRAQGLRVVGSDEAVGRLRVDQIVSIMAVKRPGLSLQICLRVLSNFRSAPLSGPQLPTVYPRPGPACKLPGENPAKTIWQSSRSNDRRRKSVADIETSLGSETAEILCRPASPLLPIVRRTRIHTLSCLSRLRPRQAWLRTAEATPGSR